jgi:hypothetical protein
MGLSSFTVAFLAVQSGNGAEARKGMYGWPRSCGSEATQDRKAIQIMASYPSSALIMLYGAAKRGDPAVDWNTQQQRAIRRTVIDVGEPSPSTSDIGHSCNGCSHELTELPRFEACRARKVRQMGKMRCSSKIVGMLPKSLPAFLAGQHAKGARNFRSAGLEARPTGDRRSAGLERRRYTRNDLE